jgi:mRNA deadenylase 3'-5' endonuclease subunit Ccr4
MQEAKSSVKNLVRQHCAEGFNSSVKVLIACHTYSLASYNILSQHTATVMILVGTIKAFHQSSGSKSVLQEMLCWARNRYSFTVKLK